MSQAVPSKPNGNGHAFNGFSEVTAFIWSVADLLRGDYKQSDYGKIILPLTVLRRLDCVLADTKAKALKKYDTLNPTARKAPERALRPLTGVPFCNISKLDFPKLKDDSTKVADNLRAYIKGFSENVRDILDRFGFDSQIDKLNDSNLLYQVVCKFAEVNLHPAVVSNHAMGSIFEELIRRFSEQSNETAGEHFTPREVIRLMVDLLFIADDHVLRKTNFIRTLYDPACGTGGMLSVADEYLRELNSEAQLQVFGQELNDESYAICKADMMIKGQTADKIVSGNSFSEDGHKGQTFDYCLSNPPFGVEWKKVEDKIRAEAELGHAGRFGAGLPRINDGSLLFLQHMISKMKPQGSRIAIVFNGSPLFTGDAGSGESEIRRWIIENDWLEAIVALPDQLFYNTGISTYVWVLTNRKDKHRKGKVQLINGSELYQKMRKSLGNKRNELSPEHIDKIAKTYGDFQPSGISKLFDNEDFGYQRIVVERPLRLNFQASAQRIERLQDESAFAKLASSKKVGPASGRALQNAILKALGKLDPDKVYQSRDLFEEDLEKVLKKDGSKLPAPVKKALFSALSERDETAEPCTDADGNPEPDPELRDYENVPLKENIHAYFDREVRPHVPDAWIDEDKTKIGYEIPFTRHFYQYKPLRPLAEIESEIRLLEKEIQGMLGEVLG